MSFLTDASLIFIPSGYKEDKAYSIKPTDGSGDLTFARASDGTRVNSDGLVERVPWNLLQQSNTFDTTWSPIGTGVLSGQTDKDGGTNAWLLRETASTSDHYIRQSVTLQGSGYFSFYAKKKDYDWVQFGRSGDGGEYANFNLVDGTIGNKSGAISAYIEPSTNGYFKCSVQYTFGVGAYVGIALIRSNVSSRYETYAGDTTKGTYIQYAQVNEGTLKPYFPTTNRQDVPRLDYSNGCPCLLLEPQRTNLLTYSEQFDNTDWLKGTSDGTTAPAITANYAVSPDGTQNADRIVLTKPSADGEWALLRQTRTITLTAHTQSIWVKATDSSQVGKYIDIYLYAGSYGEVYNFQLTNDWQRITGVRTTPTSTSCEFAFGKARTTAGGSTLANMATDVLIWGAQLEAGSYPTSYIPTTSASVTRVADAASKTGISDLIGQSEGTIFLDFVWYNSTASAADYPIMVYGSTYADFVGLNTNTNNNQMLVYSGGSSVASISGGSFVVGERYKIAMAYKANDFVYYINGVQKGTDTSGAVPVGLANIRTQTPYGSKSTGQKTEQMLFFKTRLTNDQLEYLTGNSYSTYATMASQLNYTIQ